MEKNKAIKEFMKGVRDFSKVPKEHPSNPMRVGAGKVVKAVQPHNFRLYFDFCRGGDIAYNPTQPYVCKNYGSEDHFEFGTHRVVVRKRSVEVCYLGHRKQWRRIVADSDVEIDRRLDEIRVELEDRCFGYLRDFVVKNGGSSSFKVLRERKQDWGVKGDEFLDSVPEHLIIHDSVFKKVYRDKVEFFGAAQTKAYISNRALERFSPVIAAGLDDNGRVLRGLVEANESTAALLRGFVEGVLPVFEDLKVNIATHNRVLKGIDRSFKRFNRLLGQRRLGDWL